MLKLYGPKQSSASRVWWLLHELGRQAEVEQVPVDMMTKEHHSPEFLALNPNGKVPVLVDGDLVLWDSFVINEYLVEKFGSDLGGTTPHDRALIRQWSAWALAYLAPAFEPLVTQKWQQLPESDLTTHGRAQVTKYLKVINGAVTGKDFLVADRFTLADLHVAAVIGYAHFTSFDVADFPEAARYSQALFARPAYAAARA